jgi:hypothetical protein
MAKIVKCILKISDRVWVKQHVESTFVEMVIIGETSRSWMTVPAKGYDVNYGEWYFKRYSSKLPKTLKGFIVSTDAAFVKRANWALNERWKIGNAVQSCSDPDILLPIAKLVGMEPKEDA